MSECVANIGLFSILGMGILIVILYHMQFLENTNTILPDDYIGTTRFTSELPVIGLCDTL